MSNRWGRVCLGHAMGGQAGRDRDTSTGKHSWEWHVGGKAAGGMGQGAMPWEGKQLRKCCCHRLGKVRH